MITKDELKERMILLRIDYEELSELTGYEIDTIKNEMKPSRKMSKRFGIFVDYHLSFLEGNPVSTQLPAHPTSEDIERCRILNEYTIQQLCDEIDITDYAYQKFLRTQDEELVEKCRELFKLTQKQRQKRQKLTGTVRDKINYKYTKGIYSVGKPGTKIRIHYLPRRNK